MRSSQLLAEFPQKKMMRGFDKYLNCIPYIPPARNKYKYELGNFVWYKHPYFRKPLVWLGKCSRAYMKDSLNEAVVFKY
jgi:hypothetical protein